MGRSESNSAAFEGIYKIPEENVERFKQAVTKLNKKALKCGCQPIMMIPMGTEWIKQTISGRLVTCDERETGPADPDNLVYRADVFKIIGSAPVLGGWRFLATLQNLGVDEQDNPLTLVNAVPGATADLSRFRTGQIVCEHCYTNRWRKESFVVENVATGELKQVGRQCLRDFLGHRDPHAIAKWAEYLGAFDMMASGLGGFGLPTYYELKEYLSWVCGAARLGGWLSSSAARDQGGMATAQLAWEMWHGRHIKRDRWIPDVEDIELAEKIYAWAQTLLDLPEETCNDYIHNLRVIINADAVGYKTKGYAASLWIVYKKEQDKLAKEKARKDAVPSEWFGNIGQSVTLKVRCTNIMPLESAYGTSRLHKFIDAAGRIFTWIQSAGSKVRIDEDSELTLVGTIKDHKVWKSRNGDVKETVLTRCKAVNL